MIPSKLWRQDPKKTDEYANPNTFDFTRCSLGRWLNVKLLSSAAILLSLLVFFYFANLAAHEWSIVPNHCTMPEYKWPHEPQAPPRYHGPPAEFPNRYTLILNSYKRPELLQRAVAHYAQCRNIDALRVVWCEDGLPPNRAESPGYYSDVKEVRYDIMANASLNMRFWPLEGLRTEAVLSLDDDIVAPCGHLDGLFELWRRDPSNMVGFYPRLHVMDQDCSYSYLQGFGTLWWHRSFSLVLTKAAMLHRDYLEAYTNHMASAIRQHVDTVHNCEDLAMASLVGSYTGRVPVIADDAGVADLGKGLFKVKGISSGARHGQIRSQCLTTFALQYGGALPLVIRKVAVNTVSRGSKSSRRTLMDQIVNIRDTDNR